MTEVVLAVTMYSTSVIDRALRQITIGEDCWLWTGAIDRNGYGTQGRRYAHRLVYELLVGAIPVGLQLDHLCHSNDPRCEGGSTCLHRRCVRPSHLEPVTATENKRRGQSLPARRSRQETCVQGHAFSVDNTYFRSNGTRNCKECKKQALRSFYARQGRTRD